MFSLRLGRGRLVCSYEGGACTVVSAGRYKKTMLTHDNNIIYDINYLLLHSNNKCNV